MGDQRTHAATTGDGVTLRGTVRGQGPPVVLWHGAFGHVGLDWRASASTGRSVVPSLS
jgi:hypothetical protein